MGICYLSNLHNTEGKRSILKSFLSKTYNAVICNITMHACYKNAITMQSKVAHISQNHSCSLLIIIFMTFTIFYYVLDFGFFYGITFRQ